MPIEVIESAGNGAYTTMPEPGDVPTSAPVAPQGQTDTPAANVDSAPTPAPSAEEASLAASPEPADGDEPDAPAETPITADYVNKRISRLTARHRTAEKALQDEQQARAQERAELLGRLDTLTRVLSGSAPAMPDAPAQPTGPPTPSSTPVTRTTCWLQPATAPSKNLPPETSRRSRSASSSNRCASSRTS